MHCIVRQAAKIVDFAERVAFGVDDIHVLYRSIQCECCKD
jgi:hypothetical protein